MPLQIQPSLGLTPQIRPEIRFRRELQLAIERLSLELQEKIHGPTLTFEEAETKSTVARQLVYTNMSTQEKTVVFRHTEAGLRDKVRQLHPLGTTPLSLFLQDDELYANILHCYGSLARAFEEIGIVYINPVLASWQESIIEYLGILSDLAIERITRRTHQNINRYRSQLGIKTSQENFSGVTTVSERISETQAENRQRFQDWRQRFFREFVGMRIRVYQTIYDNREQADGVIVSLLAEQNIIVARRTVNKYRKDLIARGLLLAP